MWFEVISKLRINMEKSELNSSWKNLKCGSSCHCFGMQGGASTHHISRLAFGSSFQSSDGLRQGVRRIPKKLTK